MYLAYFDETGDDGYPKYSSELFVLTSVYLHYQNWKDLYKKNLTFRTQLKNTVGFPVKTELHTKKLLLNKNPYKKFCWDDQQRLLLLLSIADFIGGLNLKVINVCIDKRKITSQTQQYYQDILDKALTFNIQRIENDLKKSDPSLKFMIITDEGRVGKMRKTTRRIQKINFIPSQYKPSTYRQDIELMIEDPLPKDSKESFFIQIADFISYFVFLYLLGKPKWHNRLQWLNQKDVEEIIKKLSPVFNLDATKKNQYGIVCYPK